MVSFSAFPGIGLLKFKKLLSEFKSAEKALIIEAKKRLNYPGEILEAERAGFDSPSGFQILSDTAQARLKFEKKGIQTQVAIVHGKNNQGEDLFFLFYPKISSASEGTDHAALEIALFLLEGLQPVGQKRN